MSNLFECFGRVVLQLKQVISTPIQFKRTSFFFFIQPQASCQVVPDFPKEHFLRKCWNPQHPNEKHSSSFFQLRFFFRKLNSRVIAPAQFTGNGRRLPFTGCESLTASRNVEAHNPTNFILEQPQCLSFTLFTLCRSFSGLSHILLLPRIEGVQLAEHIHCGAAIRRQPMSLSHWL